MNPIGEIISVATCLIAKVLMINKMNRTGQEFPGCPRSEWRVNQCVGLPDAWGPEPTRDTGGRGKVWVTGKKIVLFLPLKIGKSSKVGVFCSCPVHFFFLRPQRSCYL